MSRLSSIRAQSVFRNTDHLSGQETWIIWFHRVSVAKYFFYGTWGFCATFELLPSVINLGGSWFSFFFAASVAITSYIAGFGALFFPRTAKLELWGSLPLIGALAFYVLALLWSVPSGDVRASSFVLALTYAMIPGLRAAIIYTGTGKTEGK